MKIILTGGGTGGPAVPLLAVYKKIRSEYPQTKFLFIGTNYGPESKMAAAQGVNFQAIPAGKYRRYFSFTNLLSPFYVIAGFIKSLQLIKEFKPDLVFGAGGYVSVPVIFAAFILRKKSIIHQQDIIPSLTNKILAPFVTKITVSFESSLKDFPTDSGLFAVKTAKKIIWTGNPFREELLESYNKSELAKARAKFGIKEEIPVILVLGGATGALAINLILKEALPELTKFAYVIHATGAGKQIAFKDPRYLPFAIISNIADAYHISDFVISRAGLSTITELSVLEKIALVIPMPNSHQIYNALFLKEKRAAIVLNQDFLKGSDLVAIIKKIMFDINLQNALKENIHQLMPRDATRKIAKIIVDLCQK
jgi:UDP-N-acetylglucosamine--N-acetylmuramyl-(pentapeptide) pyrophosphoryl-undecaprenol N-acetylglucosamine transferase